jgi:hypothetical protein
MSDALENPRPRIMWWTRRFSGPLRETFPVDMSDETDQFIDMLAQADQRLGSANASGGHSEGA